jgi:uncharacterized protein
MQMAIRVYPRRSHYPTCRRAPGVALLALLLGLAWLAAATAARAQSAATEGSPSFACTPAMPIVERTICDDPNLRARDREMASLFAMSRTSAWGTGPSNQLTMQRKVLRNMRRCDVASRDYPLARCLTTLYDERIQALAIATLLQAPDVALPILRRNDPAFAPILEAVLLWSQAPAHADWSLPELATSRQRIVSLLDPYLTELHRNPDQRFGRDILSDPESDGLAVRTIEEVFLTDAHFARFLNVVGAYLPDLPSSTPPRSLPCTAILRHPDLLGATRSLFGSTIDNFVLQNDCDASLPPLPSLDALAAKLNAHWPRCDGTIRFAYYRIFASEIDEARLGLAPIDSVRRLVRRKGVSLADTDAAQRDLAAYYQTYLHRAPSAAATAARQAVANLMASAQECG